MTRFKRIILLNLMLINRKQISKILIKFKTMKKIKWLNQVKLQHNLMINQIHFLNLLNKGLHNMFKILLRYY
jgi:hypothetical protein